MASYLLYLRHISLIALSRSLALSPSFSLSFSFCLSLSLFLSFSCTHSLSLSRSFCLYYFFSLSVVQFWHGLSLGFGYQGETHVPGHFISHHITSQKLFLPTPFPSPIPFLTLSIPFSFHSPFLFPPPLTLPSYFSLHYHLLIPFPIPIQFACFNIVYPPATIIDFLIISFICTL